MGREVRSLVHLRGKDGVVFGDGVQRSSERRVSRCAAGSWCRKARRRAGPGLHGPVNTRPARANHPLHDDCGTNRPPRTGSPCADTLCCAQVLRNYAHHPRCQRQRLCPPGAFGRAVRYGWFSRAGRVLTGSREPGTRRTAFAASGAGRAQPLTRRSDGHNTPPRHASRATPPRRGGEELPASGAGRAQPLTRRSDGHNTPPRHASRATPPGHRRCIAGAARRLERAQARSSKPRLALGAEGRNSGRLAP
jgi:hypothetical protein